METSSPQTKSYNLILALPFSLSYPDTADCWKYLWMMEEEEIVCQQEATRVRQPNSERQHKVDFWGLCISVCILCVWLKLSGSWVKVLNHLKTLTWTSFTVHITSTSTEFMPQHIWSPKFSLFNWWDQSMPCPGFVEEVLVSQTQTWYANILIADLAHTWNPTFPQGLLPLWKSYKTMNCTVQECFSWAN